MRIKAYKLSINDYVAIAEIAAKNGKKPGESMQKELDEYIKQHPECVEDIGEFKDEDMLKGNLREMGYHKILDLKKFLNKYKGKG